MAPGIQRGTTEENSRRADALCLRTITGCESGYDGTRTLKPTATQSAGVEAGARALGHSESVALRISGT